MPTDLVTGPLARTARFIRVPRLAERREDLLFVLAMIQRDAGNKLGISHLILDKETPALLAHSWPENLDEMERIVTYALAVRKYGTTRSAG